MMKICQINLIMMVRSGTHTNKNHKEKVLCWKRKLNTNVTQKCLTLG